MQIDEKQALEFLRERLGADVRDIAELKGGDWSQAFGFRHGETSLVARFGMHVDDFQKDRAAHHFNCVDLPVPAVLDIGEAFDGYFCLSERVFGAFLDSVDLGQMRGLIPAVFRAMDAMREADYGNWFERVGRPEGDWAQGLLDSDIENDRVFGWHDNMRNSPMGSAPYDRALDYLRRRAPDLPDLCHMLHTDLLHYNVFVDGTRITGVIDWGNSRFGDFLYETAMFAFYESWFPETAGIDWVKEAARHYNEIGLDVPEFDVRMRAYMVHIGLEGMKYNAFLRDWDDFAAHARRTEFVMAW